MVSIEQRLTGGHHNSLGSTDEVVEDIIAGEKSLDELYQCYFSHDEVVRLRVSSAIKRICKKRPDWVLPYVDKLLLEISRIDQASTQWTLAQLFLLLTTELSRSQLDLAKSHLKKNLVHHTDWIVLNTTMETLFEWSKEDVKLRIWLVPQLDRLASEERKSVAKRAKKYFALLS